MGTASSHSPKLCPAMPSNPAWPARLRTGPRPRHLRAGPSWLGKRQPGARPHPSHSAAALVPHRLPGPPRDKAHGRVCRSPCRLRAGAEPPCLATFIPNHVPQAHAGSRQRGQDSRRRQGCCRQRVGTGWQGTRSSGHAGCPPAARIPDEPLRGPRGSVGASRTLPQCQERAACPASGRQSSEPLLAHAGGSHVPPAAGQDPCPQLSPKRGGAGGGSPQSCALPTERSPRPHAPRREPVSLPSPSLGRGAVAVRRCRSPSMAAGHRPGRPGRCTVYVSSLLRRFVVAHSRTSVF